MPNGLRLRLILLEKVSVRYTHFVIKLLSLVHCVKIHLPFSCCVRACAGESFTPFLRSRSTLTEIDPDTCGFPSYPIKLRRILFHYNCVYNFSVRMPSRSITCDVRPPFRPFTRDSFIQNHAKKKELEKKVVGKEVRLCSIV